MCFRREAPCVDDGVFCNGAESCDEANDQCLHSGDPCEDGNEYTDDLCNEKKDECENECTASAFTDSCCADPACSESEVCLAPDPPAADPAGCGCAVFGNDRRPGIMQLGVSLLLYCVPLAWIRMQRRAKSGK